MAIVGNVKISELTSYTGISGVEIFPLSTPPQAGESYWTSYNADIDDLRVEIGSTLGVLNEGGVNVLANQLALLFAEADTIADDISEVNYTGELTATVSTNVNNTNKTISANVVAGSVSTSKLSSTLQQAVTATYQTFILGNVPASNPLLQDLNTLSTTGLMRNVTIESNTIPTTSTTTWTDTHGNVKNHIVGNQIIVPDASKEEGYCVYVLTNLSGGVATWQVA